MISLIKKIGLFLEDMFSMFFILFVLFFGGDGVRAFLRVTVTVAIVTLACVFGGKAALWALVALFIIWAIILTYIFRDEFP
jgi:hypothetical protein